MVSQEFKPLGALSAIILFCGLVFVAKKWPQGLNRTFSQHVASAKSGILYYILLFSIVLPLLLVFFVGWFIPTFHLSQWFTIFIVVSALTQYLCTLIPETGGWKSRYHWLLASLSTVFLLPATLIMALAETIGAAGRVSSLVAFVIMLSIVLFLATKKAQHKYILLLQSLYFFCFFAAFLSATYFR